MSRPGLGDLLQRMPEGLAAKLRSHSVGSAGERKRATVLFCDLVGSTAIAARLDAEEYREILDHYLEIAFREIYRFEGVVNQLAGDGLMALFGAPIAHEDSPERAVRAALAIRDALARFSAEALADRDFDLRTRFGINTGMVVVGAMGDDRKMDYTAIGDTTNLAARLEGLAAPDTVLVSDVTARLVRERFELRQRPPVLVKGKDEPIVPYEVVRALDLDGPMAVPRSRGLTPLVAREEELSQILACFDRLPGGLPQVVALVGDAGSGKSRLVFELRERLRDRPVKLIEARCSALSQVVPYAPWIAMVRQAFCVDAGDAPDVALAKMRRALADIDDEPDLLAERLSVFFRTSGGLSGDSSDEIKRETFEAMGRLLGRLALQKPLAVVFEDLHWIDDLSREMLELGVARTMGRPILYLVTHRPEYEPRWRIPAAYTEIHLRALGPVAATELVRAVAGGELPGALEERIVRKAEGNSLLLEEITRGLVEQGFLRKLDRRIELTRPVDEILIPDTVQELIGARLDRLGPLGKRVAQVAAVLGRQFRRDQLEQLLAAEPIDVRAQLEELERRGLLHRKIALSEDEFRFGESVTQELAYASLLLRERRHLHGRIARLLDEAGGPMTPERSALLAHHYAHSEDRPRAVDALMRAARDAEQVPSYGAALKLYRQAWEIAAGALGERATGEDQRRALDAAVGLCRIVTIYGSNEAQGDLITITERAWDLAVALDDPAARAFVSLYQGLFETTTGDERFAHGVASIERGAEIAGAAGLQLVELNILRGLTWAYLFDGRFVEALSTVEGIIAELERIDPPEKPSDLQFGARYMRTNLLIHSGRLDEASSALLDVHEEAVRLRNRTIRSASASSLAQIYFGRAAYADAMRWADEALEVGEQIGNSGAIRPGASLALACRLELGQAVSVGRYLEIIEQGFASAALGPLYVRIVVEALLAAGDPKAAERCLDVASVYGGGRLRHLLNLSARGELWFHAGPRSWGDAERALSSSLALAREVEALPALAATLVVAGQIALARGEIRRGGALLSEATVLSRQLGLVRYGSRAEAALAEIETEPNASAG